VDAVSNPFRQKITFIVNGKLTTVHQYAEGESMDEFRSRAVCSLNLDEGAEYMKFESQRHHYWSAGHVAQSANGGRYRYVKYGPDVSISPTLTFADHDPRPRHQRPR
jgi:hypothetical protein